MKGRRRGAIGLGGLTPLLDTLFLLLFALLAVSDTRSDARVEEVHVRLPQVEPGDDSDAGSPRLLSIEVDSDSRVRILGSTTTIESREDLDRALASALTDGLPEEVSVEIRADADAKHGVTVELLQHLRLAGFADVRLTALTSTDSSRPFGGLAGGADR